MYEVSTEYSQNIAKTVRESRIYGQIRTKSGDIYEITNDDISLGSLQILSKLNKNGEFRPGGVYSSELSMALPNFGDVSKDLNGARVVLFYDLFRTIGGEEYDRVPLGLFWVDGSTIKRKFKAVSFKAYDNMLNFDFDTIALTDTLYNLLVYACTACGMALVTTQEEFEALPNGTMTATVNTARIQTWRDLLMYIGLATSSFVRCTRTGAIEVVPLTCSRTDGGVIIPAREINGDIRDRTEFSDDTERVTKLIMRRAGKAISSTLVVELTGSEKASTLEVTENPLFAALTDEEVQTALNAMLTPLVYCLNRSFKAELINGDPALDVGDYVRLSGGAVDTERGYATGMITYSVWRYRANHTIKCTLPTSVAHEASAVMTLADTETTTPVRTPPKSQLEKRIDALEAENSSGSGGTAEKLQTEGSAFYAVTRHNDKDALWFVREDGTVALNLAAGASAGDGFTLAENGPASLVFTGYNSGNPAIFLMNGVASMLIDNYQIVFQNLKGRRISSDSNNVLYAYDYNDLNSQFQVGSQVFFSLNGSGLQIQSRSKSITLSLNENGLYVNGKKVLTEE